MNKNIKNFTRLFLLTISYNIFSAQGDLDITFNPAGSPPGSITTAIGSGALVTSIAVQSDGKVVAGGYAAISGSRFALTRYNIDGSIDATFGSGGTVTTIIPGSTLSQINSIALQSDDKIVAGGYSAIGGANRFTLTRYNTDGSLDSSFGQSGVITTNLTLASSNIITSIKVDYDGKIVAGGYTTISGNVQFALARYNTDGSLDTTFNPSGILPGTVITTSIASTSQISSIYIQPDNKIIAAGMALLPPILFALARYNTDGSLDSTFNGSGIVTTNIGNSSDYINSIALQADGKIIAGGASVVGGVRSFAVARYSTTGLLDGSFGTNGIVITPIGIFDYINSVAMLSDGKIVAGGVSRISSVNHFTLARYMPNGSLDNSFGVAGIVRTTNISSSDFIYSIAIQSDGKIVAGGQGDVSSANRFVISRYLESSTLIVSPLAQALIDKYCAA